MSTISSVKGTRDFYPADMAFRDWLYETIREGIFDQVFKTGEMQDELRNFEVKIARGTMTSFAAAAAILNKYKSRNKNTRSL